MLIHLFLLALQQQPSRPPRSVADSGVIASGQRVTPAGVRSIFTGRVTGVRFGETAGELWVAAAGAAYHLAWSDDRLLARVPFDGRPGVHAIAIDRVRHRALVSTVGRLAANATVGRLPGGKPLSAADAVAQLASIDAGARGDAASATRTSGPLGEFMAGAPAVARSANASGKRVAVVPLPADDALAILDADADTVIATVALGVEPIAAAIAADGSVAWVTELGGSHPRTGEPQARQCCDPRAEAVRVDARGIAEPGSVVAVELATRRVTHHITVGRHPTGLAWDEARARLFVVDGNSDAISVVDTRTGNLAASVPIAPFIERGIGLAPTAVAVSPDGATLFVALGGINAVAVYDVAPAGAFALRGLIPTDWYPSSLDVSADGRHLAVGALFGVGSGVGTTGGSPGKRGRFVFAERGAVNVVAIPQGRELDAYTAAVAANVRLTPVGRGDHPTAPRTGIAARAVPERPGEPSLIDHVVFIVRENRTYDQVLGDLGKGDGDSTLTIFGRDVTPNAHALSAGFVTLDRTFANGGNSADGHQWLTQANETEYATWPLYVGRSYPSEGVDALAYSSGGFLWEAARARGKSVAVFGEYAPAPSDSIATVRSELLAQYRERGGNGDPAFFRPLLARRYDTRSPIPSLDSALVREYPGWTQEVPDVVKADVILDHLREWEQAGTMPNLVLIILPSDHTVGTSSGWCTPSACVADNDLALGRLVDGFTHSSFWKSMAIFSIEDDAQNGVDHVDGHRTVALAMSPYVRRGIVDHTFYNQPSVLKTVELMLGLPALSIFDLTATDLRASFIGPDERPDLTPYSVVAPRQSIYALNVRVGEIRGRDATARRRAALASARMDFTRPDAAPSESLNRIIWHSVKGWGAPYPSVRHALFFPMSLDVDDDDR